MEMLECVLFIVFVIMLFIGVGYLSTRMTGIVNKKIMNIRKRYESTIDENIIPGCILFTMIGAIIGIVIFNGNGHEINEYTLLGYVFFAWLFSMIGLGVWGLLCWIFILD